MLQDGGALTIREDFDFQQLPFTMALHNQIARGGLAGWCWNLDLGTSAVQGFGFYELGSPFFWTSMLFPADAFPYVVGWIYIAKYVVAGVTAFWFARRLQCSANAATVCALLYAFSGFQSTNLLFYHFHDVVALFPTLLIGLERFMHNRKDVVPFVLAVCINALVNYFFFVQSVVFLLLYFGFRFGPRLWHRGNQSLAKTIGQCLCLGVLGAAMAAALLVPSAIYMLNNPRAESSVFSWDKIVWDPCQLLFQLQGFLLPADAMHDHNALISAQWNSTSCWLPMVGPTLMLSYLRGKRDWLTHLIMALLVICLSPLLSSAFILFTKVYQRWWYVLVLMSALASARVVDRPSDYDVRTSARVVIGFVAALTLIVVVGSLIPGVELLFHADRFALYVTISLVGVGITSWFFGQLGQDFPTRGSNSPHRMTLVVLIAVFAVGTTSLELYLLRQGLYTGELLENISLEEQEMGTLNAIELGTQLQALNPQYRYATGDNRLTLTGEGIGVSSFCSTISTATTRFEVLFDTPDTKVWHLNKSTVPGLVELLGGKYRITRDGTSGAIETTHRVGSHTYYVIANEAMPLGVIYDQYVLYDDVEKLPLEQRALAMLQAPVVEDGDEDAVLGFATRVTTSELDLHQSTDSLIRAAKPRAVEEFWRNDYGFGFVSDTDLPALVYLAVPHDSGWTALVDGSEHVIVDSAGMMVLPLDAGAHEVEFRYETPGLRVGLAISTIACLAFVGLSLALKHS